MSDLRRIQERMAQGEYLLTRHARQRMFERNITHADIQNCARTGIVGLSTEKYILVGKDCDGEVLKVVCVFEKEILIITVF